MPGEIFPDSSVLRIPQALLKLQERYRGTTWHQAGVSQVESDGNWVLDPDGRARFDDIHPAQTPYGPNPTEFVSVATGVVVAATDSERAVVAMNGMPGTPVMDTHTGFDYVAFAAMEPSPDEIRATHLAKIAAEGYTFGD